VTKTQETARPWLARASRVVVVLTVLVLLAWAAAPQSPARAVLLLVLNGLALAALGTGVRRYRPCVRPAWLVLVGTQTCSLLAFSYWYLVPSLTGAVLPVPSPADALFLGLYAGNCVAVGLLIRSEGRGHDRETLLDVLIVTASLGALSWVFLMQPYVLDADLSMAVKLVSVAYPALDLVVLVLALRLAFSGSRTTPAKALLVAWATLQLAGDWAYGVLALRGSWTLASPVFLLWMAAFGCLAAAALHPTMAHLGKPSRGPNRGTGQARRALVIATVLVLPVVLTVRLIQGEIEDLGVITIASVLVFVLALVRGHTASGSRTTWADRLALIRLVTAFVLAALLPLALLAGSSIRLSKEAVESDARARVRATSTVSAELVQQQMQGLGQLVGAYAERRLLADAFGDGTFETFDQAMAQRHLDQLMEANPNIAGVFATDASGRLTAVEPSTPEIVGKDFSYRDWYTGATTAHRPYVSEAYTTAIRGEARVVAVASVVRRPDNNQVVGILSVIYDLQAVQGFSQDLADAQGVSLRITDQRGTVVAAPGAEGNQLVDARSEAGVATALRGQESLHTIADAGGDELLSAYAPVPGLGWTVTAQVPTATAYASLGPLRSTVLGIAVLLGQVLLGGLVLMARSQRQRREAERSLLEREEATRGILEAAADAFVSIDPGGVVRTWSAQSQALFGWTSEQACGTSLAELIVPAALRESHVAGIRRLASTGTPTILGQRTELTALHRDGHEFPVELVIWQSAAGGTVSFNAFIHDISDRKRHEAQLATARDEALDASRAKSDFLAVMSYELRTPMNGVMGMTSLLLGTTLSPQQRDYAETVRSSADSLLGLLNDVLDLSKVEADKLELEVLDFDLHPVVRDVVHLMDAGAREKGVALTADIDDDVRLALRGDPARLRQVLLNLVGNALKFTETGSVRLRVLAGSARGAEAGAGESLSLRFEVTDTGIGIAPQACERLFEAFSQADASTTRNYGGTGLGLAISKSLVALFGGEIGVDSEVGVGSTFWFTARFQAGAPTLADAPKNYVPRPPPATPGLVLVVDDNATNQKIAVRMLETLGHRADVAASGVEAVMACAQVPYDLVLMDCRMPVMDGYQATATIRAAEAGGRRIPIVAMTASAMAADRQRCLDVGMDDYLSKPVRVADVADKVDRWLRRGGAGEVPHRPGTVPSQPGPPDRTPVLDEAVVAGLRSLGPDFLARLVPVFVLGAPERLAAIRTAVLAGDAGALSTAAHALLGSAANMGGARVAAVCRTLEESAVAGRLEDAPADLLVLESELALMLTAASALTKATV